MALRYYPKFGLGGRAIAVLTVEPPTGNLEHRAVGVGGGMAYAAEKGHWSVIAYELGRTESSLDEGEKRGDRFFLGTGLAYESKVLPFSLNSESRGSALRGAAKTDLSSTVPTVRY